MKDAHDFANISGQTVIGEKDKIYYIKETIDENNVAQTILRYECFLFKHFIYP